jgi:hypothetical protein
MFIFFFRRASYVIIFRSLILIFALMIEKKKKMKTIYWSWAGGPVLIMRTKGQLMQV